MALSNYAPGDELSTALGQAMPCDLVVDDYRDDRDQDQNTYCGKESAAYVL